MNSTTQPTPKRNISELEKGIYKFIRKLRLIYHFHDLTYEDKSIVKNEFTFTPKNNENQELETIWKNLSETKNNIKRISNNIPNIRKTIHEKQYTKNNTKIINNYFYHQVKELLWELFLPLLEVI